MSAGLDKRFIKSEAGSAYMPDIYHLAKRHKLSDEDKRSLPAAAYKIRPIISSVDGWTNPKSQILNKIAGELFSPIPSQLTNTGQFLGCLRRASSKAIV